MPGLSNKPLNGYFETAYENPWPGLVTNLPTSQIPPGAASACNAMVVRGHLQPQPAIFNVLGNTIAVTMPTFAAGENVCLMGNLAPMGQQQGFTVIITNIGVYIDYVVPGAGDVKDFTKIFTFPTAYPRYTRFGATVIGNTLYFSSASQLGLYALRPTYSVATVEVVNPGGYFTSTPTVVFSDGGGLSAEGTATVSGGNLISIAIFALHHGGGYVVPPIVGLNGGGSGIGPGQSIASAVAVLESFPNTYVVQEVSAFTGVASVAMTGTTTGYTSPTVAFIGGGGTGASATAILATDGSGAILGIVMNSFGQNYTSVPTVQLLDPTGTPTSVTLTATLFQGQPFIGGDFMSSISNRLVMVNIIGGDGNNTVPVESVSLGNENGTPTGGAGYASTPSVQFIGGGGAGAVGYATLDVATGQVGEVGIGTTVSFNGTLTPSSNTITNCSTVTGIQVGMSLSDGSLRILAGTTVTAVSAANNINFEGAILSGATAITGASSTTGLVAGQPISSSVLPSGTYIASISGSTVNISQGAIYGSNSTGFIAIPGNTVTMSANANVTSTVNVNVTATGFVQGDQGSGYYATPLVQILGNSTLTATAFAQLSNIPQRNSSQTRYQDRVAWSAPNAYGYFDPNFLTAPGGYNTLAEAKGMATSINVVESVAFLGHNGGITEMTPNTSSGFAPFAFYPLWGGEKGQVVRYGSMAQRGTTLCFLGEESAWSLTPNGVSEIGQNIANLLEIDSEAYPSPYWNNGNFPLQGLYGSIVVIEGQLHYLIGLSTDDPNLYGTEGARNTNVFDLNMSENSWHFWSYPGYTLTCPIFESIDTALYTGINTNPTVQIAGDSWLLAALTVSSGATAPYTDQAVVYELATLVRQIKILETGPGYVATPTISYQFRTESPSIARMQQERRILIEYENTPCVLVGTILPQLTLTYTGQQDPTTQTGTVAQQNSSTASLTQLTSGTIPGQVLTMQADFGTFTGVCTSLGISATNFNSLVNLVRMTQIADLPKAQVP